MKNVQDLYPLTPMQRVMLLHAAAGRGPDALHTQFCYEVRGDIDERAFRSAWQDVAERHDALRTAFLWEDVDDPLQVVRRRVEVPVDVLDWTPRDVDASSSAFEALRVEDETNRFDIERAPLMRVTLARVSNDRALLLWSSHHLVLDRWCSAVVLEDFARAYDSRCGRPRPSVGAPRGQFRDYVGWVLSRDRDRASDYWRDELHGIDGAGRTVLSPSGGRADRGSAIASVDLSSDLSSSVRAAARDARVTPSVILQAAWALVMNRRTRRQDVAFGMTVSGRPPELSGVDSIVGSFVTNVPMRVRIPASGTVGAWLEEVHKSQRRRSPHEFLSAAEIHAASGLDDAESLFDSLLVWLAPMAWEPPTGLRLSPLPGHVTTAWPVTVSVTERSDGISIAVESADGSESAHELLDDLQGALVAIATHRSEDMGEIDGLALDPSDRSTVNGTRSRTARVGATCASSGRGREGEELEMIENIVMAECRSVLGLDRVQSSDGFFEMGGNSLSAARMHARLERALGRSIPILSLFREPTLGDMARSLAGRELPVTNEMARSIQPRGSRTPLICLSSPEVNSIGYALLSKHLSDDQPVYLVQSPPISDEVVRMAITQIPEFGARYAEAVREIQPEGPYRLLGMCDGALVGIEVAKLLEERGDEVEFFGVLNSHSLNTLSWRNRLHRVEFRLGYYRRRLGALRRLGPRGGTEEFTRWARARWSRRRRPVANSGDSAPPGGNAPQQLSGYTRESIHREWQELDWPDRHLPERKFSGKVTVFRIRRQPYFRVRDEDLGWSRHADRVEVVHLETDAQLSGLRDRREWRESHLDILREPDVRRTAAALQRSLDRLESTVSV
ncbi:MAG: condensation domain-containing protein [Planctomycetota bacterium]